MAAAGTADLFVVYEDLHNDSVLQLNANLQPTQLDYVANAFLHHHISITYKAVSSPVSEEYPTTSLFKFLQQHSDVVARALLTVTALAV